MKYIYIGKENAASMEDIHDLLQAQLDFPEYYGRNLDALNDCLSEISDELLILVADKEYLSEKLGPRFTSMTGLFENLCKENSNIRIRYFE